MLRPQVNKNKDKSWTLRREQWYILYKQGSRTFEGFVIQFFILWLFKYNDKLELQ